MVILLLAMRDLSQTQFVVRGGQNQGRLLRIIFLFILISGAFWVGGRFFANGRESGGSVILREAPRGLVPVAVGDVVNSQAGVELTTQTAVMRDVKYGGEASAVVKRSFGGGIYILTVDATLPNPKNVNYQVWLVGSSGAVPIDYMRGSKTSWSLSLRDSDKYSTLRGVWITLERGKDDIPEEHVMEGSF